MSAFRFEPPGGGWPRRSRPRLVRPGGGHRGRRILVIAVVVVVAVAIVATSLINLRVRWLFLDNVGQSTVFWTPLVAQFVLFLIGLVVTGGLVAVNIPFWAAAAASVDRRGRTVGLLAGGAVALLTGVAGGAFLAAQWQDVLLWLHGRSFGVTEPVFGQDVSFYVFTLPVLDDLQAIGWAVALVSLLGALAMLGLCLFVENAPEDVPLPLRPPAGHSPSEGARIAVLQAGTALAAVFVLAALGAHYGAFHLTTSQHDNFVGLDATQRNVVRPVLGALQVVAVLFAVASIALVVWRRGASPVPTAVALGGLLGGWLAIAGLSQGVPAAIYQATSVNPNALSAQRRPITDFLTVSREAWDLRDAGGADVLTRSFGSPSAATPADLAADPGTLRNVRVQDVGQLPETFAQIDRSRSYQTYPTVTVDRYRDAKGNETMVMLSPRELAEDDIPNPSFVTRVLKYTHGYGLVAVSVNQFNEDGRPALIAGRAPLQQILDVPGMTSVPDLVVRDPRIYCGLATTQPVVVNTQTPEFDYPAGDGEKDSSFGGGPGGMPTPGFLDRLAVSLGAFGGLDYFLTGQLGPDSRVLLHRQIGDRLATIAPFLRVDGDPYLVADPVSGHLVYIADAYVTSDRMPDSYRLDDGTSYMRNAVKAVIDAKTCQTTLYAVDLNEPLTSAYNEIFPGLLTPLSRMPRGLRAHLRYPEDLFQAQARVYAPVHIDPRTPDVLFDRSNLYRLSDELTTDRQTSETRPHYVELTLPGESGPEFSLLQTFSPARSGGGGGSSNVLSAMLVARSDYTSTDHPKLIAIPIAANDNVLGPLQFDNNINTNAAISQEITLLGQSGSQVVLGDVIVLPFNNQSFLYLRPFYVLASSQGTSGAFPRLYRVIVGTQDSIAEGPDFATAVQNLFPGQTIAGLQPGRASPSPGATPSPSPGASPSPSASPGGTPPPGLSGQVLSLVQDLLAREQDAQQALSARDFTRYGQDQAAIQKDEDQLRQLLGPGVSITPAASPSPGTR